MLGLVSKLAPMVAGLPSLRPDPAARVITDKGEAFLAANRSRQRVIRIAFLALVVIPTTIATLFFALLAAPRYVSDVQYIVRSVSSQRASGLEMLFRTFGLSRTVDDGYAVEKYVLSKDVINALQKKVDLREIFGRPEADIFSRFPRFWERDNEEYLHRYFLQRVTIREDDVKGITTLSVATFRPEDSVVLAKAIIELAEGMVNQLNARAQKDTVESAKEDVAAAETRVVQTQRSLSEFRMRELLIDPSKTSLSFIEQIATLNKQLSSASAQRQETRTLSPLSPQISSQEARIKAIQDQIAGEKSKLFGDGAAMTAKISEFEQLTLQRDIADSALAAAISALDTARQEARRQHIYIEEVVAPNLADWPIEPQRIRGILTVLVFGFAIFAVIWILSVGVGEHSQ